MSNINRIPANIQSIPIRENVNETNSINPFSPVSFGSLTATNNSQGKTLGLMGNHQNEEHGSRLYTYI